MQYINTIRFLAVLPITGTLNPSMMATNRKRSIMPSRRLVKPSFILVRTHIGFGSPHKQDTFSAHSSTLGEEEVKLTKLSLGWPVEPLFHVPEEAGQHFRLAISRGDEEEFEWNAKFARYEQLYPELAGELPQLIKKELPHGPQLILIASGSEVGLIVEAGQQLQKQNIAVRLVSMPSTVDNVYQRAMALLERGNHA